MLVFSVAAKLTSPTIALLLFVVSEMSLPSSSDLDYIGPTVDFLLRVTLWGSLSPAVDKQSRLLTQAAVLQVA